MEGRTNGGINENPGRVSLVANQLGGPPATPTITPTISASNDFGKLLARRARVWRRGRQPGNAVSRPW